MRGRVAEAQPWRLPSAAELWGAKARLDLVPVTDNYHSLPNSLNNHPKALCEAICGTEHPALLHLCHGYRNHRQILFRRSSTQVSAEQLELGRAQGCLLTGIQG
jgi:hypothetical protein